MERFKLPNCAYPKPGEKVVCYTDTTKMIGITNGYDKEGIPIIKAPTGHHFTPLDKDSIRLENPYERIEPSWKTLSAPAVVRECTIEEKHLFEEILSQKLPGNISYLDFISEIWYRGFDIFLVGGTVRDVINGAKSNDVDLVTSMPLSQIYSLATSMFGFIPEKSCKYKTGYLKIGGGGGDPFMDLKTFCSHGLGTDHVVFGNNIGLDICSRDFACNAIYYEPINQLLIDPSGIGIVDAIDKRLTIVADKSIPNKRYQIGTIPIRFMKFVLRGYIYTPDEQVNLVTQYIPELRSMKFSHRTSYLIAQLSSKSGISKEEAIETAKAMFKELGVEEAWELYFTKSTN